MNHQIFKADALQGNVLAATFISIPPSLYCVCARWALPPGLYVCTRTHVSYIPIIVVRAQAQRNRKKEEKGNNQMDQFDEPLCPRLVYYICTYSRRIYELAIATSVCAGQVYTAGPHQRRKPLGKEKKMSAAHLCLRFLNGIIENKPLILNTLKSGNV
jgi:hypothetical protein